VTRHRYAALELAKERRQARIQDHINAMEMQNYLNDRIEDGLMEIHRLNNERNQFLTLHQFTQILVLK
jgi:hypothetical protein